MKIHCWVFLDENENLIGVSLDDDLKSATQDIEEFHANEIAYALTHAVKGTIEYNQKVEQNKSQ